jgi:O-antigen ligase
MSGNLPPMMVSNQGKWLSLLCFWIFAGLPFSMWKGGSISVFNGLWIKSFVMFFIVGGLIFTLKQMKTMVMVLALSTGYEIYLALHSGVAEGDRLSMTYGTLGNANDLASALLTGLPFVLYILFDGKTNLFLRLLSLPLAILLMVAVLKTGSRGALIAIAILIVVVFFKSSAGMKLSIVVGCIFFVGLFAAVVPSSLRARYMTILSDSGARTSREALSAVESSGARRELLKNSIKLTLKHPVFGVGLGQFAPQSFNLLISEGKGGMWFTSHDVFGLVAAETGLPGLFFFCGTIVAAFLPAWRMSKLQATTPELGSISSLSYTLMMALVVYFVCGIFSTQAYTYQLPVLASLSVALERIAAPYIAASAASTSRNMAIPYAFVNRRLARNGAVSSAS